MGIQGRASLIKMEIEKLHLTTEHVAAIEEYVHSANNLTKQILGFARGGRYEVKPIDINELVTTTASMFGRTRKEIIIHDNRKPTPIVVNADKSQIEQVLLNLLINAWQAMPEGGDLFLETSLIQLDEVTCVPLQIDTGQYARISVTDTGKGIEASIIGKVFDPFFTTKEKGRGTGLGLASAYGIIKNHSGTMTVYSEVGHGTTFNVYLPISNQKAYQEQPINGELMTGSETILIVDDEEIIIAVTKGMLEVLGYHVIVAHEGLQAIETIRENKNDIDLVILDMIMPLMEGGEVFNRVREIRPDLPVMLSSGYSLDGKAGEIMNRGCNGFIQKPFNMLDLSQKIRGIFDGRDTDIHG